MVRRKNNTVGMDSYQTLPTQGLTVAEFRQYPGCEAYSREEAEEILQSLRQLALIVCEHVRRNPAWDPMEEGDASG
ncbi:hypothetical protein GCM10028821_44770 [Hymenobacter jeollabukensis]